MTFLNVTLIVPRNCLPRAVFGMTIAHVARPARTVPTARNGFRPSVTLQVATPSRALLPCLP